MKGEFSKGELYGFITGMASTALARRLQKNFKTKGIDITVEQWSVLYHLWRNDGISQQDLCIQSFRDKPSITRLVDNLEKLKLVKRTASKEDKRINRIFLTAKGKKLQETTMEMANQTIVEAMQGVSERDIELCKNVLYQVFENLKTLAAK